MANTTKTPTTIKNEARGKAFTRMMAMYVTEYGEENVKQTGDSEIAVAIDTAPTGEKIWATFSPTVKDYCERKTRTKTIFAYDVDAAATKYAQTVTAREQTAAEDAEKKAAKIERDKAAREKRKAEREQKKNK